MSVLLHCFACSYSGRLLPECKNKARGTICLRYADQKLKEEEQRACKYLEPGPHGCAPTVLTECCVGVLVTAFKEPLLAECPGMIRAGETQRLQLLFGLLDRVPDGVAPMLRDLEHHILSQGLADMLASADIITQVRRSITLVPRELGLPSDPGSGFGNVSDLTFRGLTAAHITLFDACSVFSEFHILLSNTKFVFGASTQSKLLVTLGGIVCHISSSS